MCKRIILSGTLAFRTAIVNALCDQSRTMPIDVLEMIDEASNPQELLALSKPKNGIDPLIITSTSFTGKHRFDALPYGLQIRQQRKELLHQSSVPGHSAPIIMLSPEKLDRELRISEERFALNLFVLGNDTMLHAKLAEIALSADHSSQLGWKMPETYGILTQEMLRSRASA